MAYLFLALTVLLDQATKWLMYGVVFAKNAQGIVTEGTTIPLIDGVFHLTYRENEGAAWGMLKDAQWVFMLISTVAIVGLLLYLIFAKQQPRSYRLTLALVCGGGIGNMIDRIFLGYVIDFLDFRLIDFPVFNLADSCICVGTALFAFFYLKTEWKKEQEKKQLS